MSENENKPGGEVILYQTEDLQTRLRVRLDGQTAWLTQAQIADLFQTTPQNITLHLQAIYNEGELQAATCKDYLQVRMEGARPVRRALKHYNLDAIIAVGYRVKSPRGTQFGEQDSGDMETIFFNLAKDVRDKMKNVLEEAKSKAAADCSNT